MGLAEALANVVSQNRGDLTLAQRACITLANVSEFQEAAVLLQDDAAVELVIQLMEDWPTSDEVQVWLALCPAMSPNGLRAARTVRSVNMKRHQSWDISKIWSVMLVSNTMIPANHISACGP